MTTISIVGWGLILTSAILGREFWVAASRAEKDPDHYPKPNVLAFAVIWAMLMFGFLLLALA